MGLSDIRDRTFAMLPGRYRDRIVLILVQIDEAVSAFFRGRLIIMVIKAVVTSVALAIVGLPYALLLGLITGVGSLIPIAGFLMGIIPAVLIALFDSGSVTLALIVAGIFLVIEIVENYWLTPWVLKDRVGLHSVTILVSVFAAGALFGFVGMLLAVPITSIAKILFCEFILPEIRAFAAEKPEE
jgi:predicted PurR-regulated permease PerM